MQLVFPVFSATHLVAQILVRPKGQPVPSPARIQTEEDLSPGRGPDRADRAFLMELMTSHPEAVQSETGMMLLMAQYPGRV